mgnify:CR=1 FL=1
MIAYAERATTATPSIEERERMSFRPDARPIMYHHWRDLLFLHFPVPPQLLQRLVPPSLTIDTFPDASGREMGWIGVVAFRMFGIRPRGLPPMPVMSAFPETNVRTYVHRDGMEPGVWFLSMDASPKLACRIARAWYKEPYTFAEMYCRRDGERITYRHRRLEGIGVQSEITCQAGDSMPASVPGTLQHFLTERYQLYTGDRARLWKARVWHEPYPLREVEILHCAMDLLKPFGIDQQPWVHACLSDGVDTEIFRLEPEGR